jgi:hypothetical protein
LLASRACEQLLLAFASEIDAQVWLPARESSSGILAEAGRQRVSPFRASHPGPWHPGSVERL